jgi:hypothetical protein
MRSSRTNRATFSEREAQLTELVAELSTLGDDVSVDLAERLLHCQMERRARAKAFAETKRPIMGWPYRCKSAACWACRRAIMAKWRSRAEGLFADADSEDCSYITILLARIGELSALPDVIKKLRRDVRNVRDVMARTSRHGTRCRSWDTLSSTRSRKPMFPCWAAVAGR